MKKNRYYNHYYNNRRNTPKNTLADINIAVYDDLGLDRIGKDLNLIYENISEADVRNLNISKTEKVLSQIEKSKCYHLTVMPLIMYGARLNTIFLEKYLAKVILAHPEYLYYLRPLEGTEYGLCGTDPNMFAVVNSKIAYNLYCHMWELDKEQYIHPHKIITQLKEFLLRIGNSEEDADLFIENCIEDD